MIATIISAPYICPNSNSYLFPSVFWTFQVEWIANGEERYDNQEEVHLIIVTLIEKILQKNFF